MSIWKAGAGPIDAGIAIKESHPTFIFNKIKICTFRVTSPDGIAKQARTEFGSFIDLLDPNTSISLKMTYVPWAFNNIKNPLKEAYHKEVSVPAKTYILNSTDFKLEIPPFLHVPKNYFANLIGTISGIAKQDIKFDYEKIYQGQPLGITGTINKLDIKKGEPIVYQMKYVFKILPFIGVEFPDRIINNKNNLITIKNSGFVGGMITVSIDTGTRKYSDSYPLPEFGGDITVPIRPYYYNPYNKQKIPSVKVGVGFPAYSGVTKILPFIM